MNPTITIAIPVFNNAHVVHRAITSALNQSLLPFEVMIVDDGSEDDLESLISNYKHTILRYLRKEHSGLAKTRNFAVNHSHRAFSNLYYLWARIEMEDKHFLNMAMPLLLGTLHYPFLPFRLAR